jgi:hypothetical protein
VNSNNVAAAFFQLKRQRTRNLMLEMARQFEQDMALISRKKTERAGGL